MRHAEPIMMPRPILIFVILLCLALCAHGQPGGQKGGGGAANASSQGQAANSAQSGSPTSSGSSGGLQGISYAHDSWAPELRLPAAEMLGIKQKNLIKDRVVLLYRLVPGNSAAQPFILEAMRFASWKPRATYTSGAYATPARKNGHFYQAQAQSNPNPPLSWPTNGTAVVENPGLSWIDMGAVMPGLTPQSWQPDTPYEDGTRILAVPTNNHYYQAQTSEVQSGSTEPQWSTDGTSVQDVSGLWWVDMGLAWDSVNPSHPLLMNQFLVIAIDVRAIPDSTWQRFKILNLNVTNQQGSSLNPTPIRPSIAAGTASGAELGSARRLTRQAVYYMTWPNQIPGDTIPTVSVNLVYTPVAPALPFQPDTFYPAGSIVISTNSSGGTSTTNGHYYVALNSGISSDSAPLFDTGLVPVPTYHEAGGSGLSWKDMGTSIPAAPASPAWQANTAYSNGAQVVTAANLHKMLLCSRMSRIEFWTCTDDSLRYQRLCGFLECRDPHFNVF